MMCWYDGNWWICQNGHCVPFSSNSNNNGCWNNWNNNWNNWDNWNGSGNWNHCCPCNWNNGGGNNWDGWL